MTLYMTALIASAVLAVSAPLFAQENPATQPVAPAIKPAAAGQTDVPVKAVILFSSGVGYFEHFGTVAGNSATELQFKTAQINDILKSLVLQDMDGGQVSTVSYPSEDPIAKTLKTFQVDITNNPPLAELLNQLRGATVSVTVLNDKVDGTILGCEKRLIPGAAGGQPIEAWFLNLVSGPAIKQVELSKLSGVELKDPKLQDELTRALTALAGARNQDKKPVVINFRGDGERRVKLGYVVETPVWKTSYRLILGDDKASLQGWAIVENQTDNDWTNVQLSLVSGRPISFVQNLYSSLYIPRPVVEPELFASLRPQRYEGGARRMTEQAKAEAAPTRDMVRKMRIPAALPAPGGSAGLSGGNEGDVDAPMDATASISAAASASQLGELFQYTIGNVSLARQQSAMIPIVTDKVEVERLSIYNAAVLPRNPLNGAMLTNSTQKHLLQGPITVFDANSYAGDAQIDNLPPGQKRLLSFGVDLQVVVDSTKVNQVGNVTSGKIVKGVLQLTRRTIATQEFALENKADKDKTIVVETPVNQNWQLVDTDKPFEATPQLYRFKVALAKGEAKTLKVSQQIVTSDTLEILPIDLGTLVYYATNSEIPTDVRKALGEVVTRRQSVVALERQITEADQQTTAITQEQNRIRENMKTVDKASQYYNRLLGKLNDQESAIEKLQTNRDEIRTKLDGARKELENHLQNLTVG